jgi:YD repeat-containing protein
MTASTVELEVVGLQLHDAPVGYVPPVGPAVKFIFFYSHRDVLQPATFAYTNFGPKWTFNWLSYVTDTVNSSASAQLYVRGGGAEPYTFSSDTATTSYAGPYSQSILTRTVNGGGNSTSFTVTHPDGSYEEYAQASGNQFFMTAVSDAAGNLVTLTYDASMRITAITDAIGQVTTLTYGLSGSPLVVTKITDPFGRSASFSYNGSGLLGSITDVLGITSSYTYGQGSDPDFINTLTTPYGTTTFTYGDLTTNPSLGDALRQNG